MGTGYTRNDTANNIADGNVINASDLDGEFDAIQAAFNASTGHSHDGTTGEGPQIGTGGIADLAVTTGKIANDAVTLGTKTSGNYVATGAVSGVGLSGSASAEGATFTVTSNATDANTASTIVARDASGNFSAGNVTVGNLITAGNVDGRDVSVDGAKLDGIEAGATADQTKADIDALGINAATLDSIDSTQFLRSDAADTKTAGDLSFADSVKATFGAGSDLQIYHDASNSYIVDSGTGNLQIAGTTNVNIQKGDLSEYMAKFIADGAVELYYDSSKKLATTSGGIDVTGTVTADGIIMSDNEVIKLGSSADLWIYHNGTHSIISDEGTGSLLLQGASQIVMQHPSTGEDYIVANANGAVNLYYDNSQKLATTSSGIDVTGNITVSGTVDGRDVASDGSKLDGIAASATANPNAIDNLIEDTSPQLGGALDVNGYSISFGDNEKARFGNADDLQIYHNGSHSFIDEVGTGNLYIRADNNLGLQRANGEYYFLATADGGASLYHDNSPKLATTSGGISVTGNIDVTGDVNDANNIYMANTLYHVGDTDTYFQFNAANEARIVTGGSESIRFKTNYIDCLENTAGSVETASKTGAVTPDMQNYNSFVWTLTGNITLNNPTNEVTGSSGVFIFIHSGAARTVSLGTDWETAGAAGLTLSGTAGAVDIVPYFVQSAGNILLGTPQLAFA